jgi:hypothetical protein
MEGIAPAGFSKKKRNSVRHALRSRLNGPRSKGKEIQLWPNGLSRVNEQCRSLLTNNRPRRQKKVALGYSQARVEREGINHYVTETMNNPSLF